MSATQFQAVGGRPLLICAHPGHELLLFHWMEMFRPAVFLLTDGSGGNGQPRTVYSETCLRGLGAALRTECPALPDRVWYEPILRCDARPFLAVIEAAQAAARQLGSTLIVSDAVDGYNPMHDLCEAVGAAVAARLGRDGVVADHLVNAVTPGAASPIEAEFSLDPAALERKRAAVGAYIPLAEEARRLAQAAPGYLTRECLRRPVFGWPENFSPGWEVTGRGRVTAQRYHDVIEYRRHVRPIAQTLRGATAS